MNIDLETLPPRFKKAFSRMSESEQVHALEKLTELSVLIHTIASRQERPESLP